MELFPPTASVNLFIQVFAFGKHDGKLLLNTSEGGVAYPGTGSSSLQVTNDRIWPSVTGSLLAAANVKETVNSPTALSVQCKLSLFLN